MLINNQNGFTLIELVLVITVIAVLSAVFTTNSFQKLDTAKINVTLTQAQNIANTAEKIRTNALSSMIDANGIYQYTYATLPANSTVSSMYLMLGSTSPYPDDSPFGTTYLINVNANVSTVTVNIPFDVNLPGVLNTPVGATTDITITGKKTKLNKPNLKLRSVTDKRNLYLEGSR